MKYEFPAVFYDDDGQIAFHFYDADWFSCGENIADAIKMAQDVLGGRLMRLERDGGQIPTPTPLPDVKLLPNQLVCMIEADTDEYAAQLETLNDRKKISGSDNPIRELLNLKHMKIKELSDALECPYRTCQDWNSGKSKPPAWVLSLILDKFL